MSYIQQERLSSADRPSIEQLRKDLFEKELRDFFRICGDPQAERNKIPEQQQRMLKEWLTNFITSYGTAKEEKISYDFLTPSVHMLMGMQAQLGGPLVGESSHPYAVTNETEGVARDNLDNLTSEYASLVNNYQNRISALDTRLQNIEQAKKERREFYRSHLIQALIDRIRFGKTEIYGNWPMSKEAVIDDLVKHNVESDFPLSRITLPDDFDSFFQEGGPAESDQDRQAILDLLRDHRFEMYEVGPENHSSIPVIQLLTLVLIAGLDIKKLATELKNANKAAKESKAERYLTIKREID